MVGGSFSFLTILYVIAVSGGRGVIHPTRKCGPSVGRSDCPIPVTHCTLVLIGPVGNSVPLIRQPFLAVSLYSLGAATLKAFFLVGKESCALALRHHAAMTYRNPIGSGQGYGYML